MVVLVHSVWSEQIELPKFESLKGDLQTEVLIIGGGLAGILCAYMLKQANVDYVLAEAKTICSGITKNTTAKITSQHGLIYDKLVRGYGREKAAMYLQANQQALEKYKLLCEKIDCDYKSEESFVYSLDDRQKIEKEIEALRQLGFQAEWKPSLPLPFKIAGAIGFKNQAEFHPLKFVKEISKGLHIFERTKVKALEGNKAITDGGTIHAKKIIVATHFPFINKHGSYFLKMYQHRSYVLALENVENMHGMYVDEQKTGLSFRNYKDLLLLGGGSHRTGKKGGNWHELRAFARKYYPNAHEKYAWATQDCMTLDGLPYIGRYAKQTTNLFVATGFNKWGMTSSMVAAMILTDMVLDKENPYAAVFSPSRSMLKPQLAVNALEATMNLLTVSRRRCPHLGCALKWNQVERSWDCPCHGSRFSQSGKLIDNPATDDLKKG